MLKAQSSEQFSLVDKPRVNKILPSEHHHQFIPLINIPSKPLPSMSSLMKSTTRFYFKDLESQIESKILEKEVIMEINEANNNQTSSFDLGLSILENVIQKMENYQKDNLVQELFDNQTSRRAGLNSYCEYLHGNGTIASSIPML